METLHLRDDGAIPNNPRLPALLWRGAAARGGGAGGGGGAVRPARLAAGLAQRHLSLAPLPPQCA